MVIGTLKGQGRGHDQVKITPGQLICYEAGQLGCETYKHIGARCHLRGRNDWLSVVFFPDSQVAPSAKLFKLL